MCRHLAWFGEPRSVAALVLEPEHGLLRQSYQPRRQSHGLMNADGWGVGYLAEGREPVRWRSARPLWSDTSFASVAPELRSGRVLAAVRSATVGMPADETAAAPFTDGQRLLSHNGRVDRSVLPTYVEAESVCDSAVLAAHVFAVTSPGDDVEKLGAVVTDVARLDPTARLSLLVAEDDRVLGVSWGDGLSYLEEPDGVVLASEPYDDDPRWVDVPDHHLVEVTRAGVRAEPLSREPRR